MKAPVRRSFLRFHNFTGFTVKELIMFLRQ